MYVPAFFGLLLAIVVTGQHVEITPQQAVSRVGDELRVLCKVSFPIDSCRFLIGQTPYRLKPNVPDNDVEYHGQGYDRGECGAYIKHVKEEWNGNISCTLPPQTGSIELTASMRLIVAKAPEAPILLSPQQPMFREGDVFEAQCIVARGRPEAKITWFLNGEQLLVGQHQAIVTAEPDSDLVTVRQNFTRRLSAADAGAMLTCRAEHQALEQPKEASRQLLVHYPPHRPDGESDHLTIFGLKLGAEGRLNVTVRASPAPAAEWTAGESRLTAPAVSDDGRLTAVDPTPLGGGEYNVTLILARVEKEDVDRIYYLRVRNDLGHAEYMVQISTMDEPAGVELDTGAIVGIVIAVLVLLIAVFLIVFAKATDRWCFAGSSAREHAKSSGESSDTESAVGGRASTRAGGRLRGAAGAAGARLAAIRTRVLNALPRRDRVQATHAGDDDKPSEEKKGVVYAELALGEAPRGVGGAGGDKPPPAAEYAEIVYTEQGTKEAKE